MRRIVEMVGRRHGRGHEGGLGREYAKSIVDIVGGGEIDTGTAFKGSEEGGGEVGS
jgi:hypothetical protein